MLVVKWFDAAEKVVFQKAYAGPEKDVLRAAFIERRGSNMGRIYTVREDGSLEFYRTIIPLP